MFSYTYCCILFICDFVPSYVHFLQYLLRFLSIFLTLLSPFWGITVFDVYHLKLTAVQDCHHIFCPYCHALQLTLLTLTWEDCLDKKDATENSTNHVLWFFFFSWWKLTGILILRLGGFLTKAGWNWRDFHSDITLSLWCLVRIWETLKSLLDFMGPTVFVETFPPQHTRWFSDLPFFLSFILYCWHSLPCPISSSESEKI